MVKGLAKRVVVVKSPDKRLFEEAIFILKEDAAAGVSAQDVVSQAQQIAANYMGASSRLQRLLRPALYILGGMLLCAAGVLIGRMI